MIGRGAGEDAAVEVSLGRRPLLEVGLRTSVEGELGPSAALGNMREEPGALMGEMRSSAASEVGRPR